VSASSHSGRKTFLTNLANKGTAIHILETLADQNNISTIVSYLYSSSIQLKATDELVLKSSYLRHPFVKLKTKEFWGHGSFAYVAHQPWKYFF